MSNRLNKTINIYEEMGAKRDNWAKSRPVCPAIFDDGSATHETQAWALNKLGFVDTSEVKFSEYATELHHNGEAVNLCPYKATKDDLSLYLSPSSRLGFFYCQYGGLKKTHFVTSEYSQIDGPTIEQLFDDVTAAIAQIKQRWPASFTRNVGKDPRYVFKKTFWRWVFKKQKEWFYEGRKCELVEGWLAGEKGFYYAEFGEDQALSDEIIDLVKFPPIMSDRIS